MVREFLSEWAGSHSSKVIRRLELDLFPWLGSRSIGGISAPELLSCLRRVEGRGALDTAHRLHQNCGQIFRYAIATGRAERDPSADLRGALVLLQSLCNSDLGLNATVGLDFSSPHPWILMDLRVQSGTVTIHHQGPRQPS